ncbi:MAG: hypothetical protein MRZ29_02630, partial [Oscillospiraceae bacterium]|nr:hypothetical protein [Oscillospiraceae bacterium]
MKNKTAVKIVVLILAAVNLLNVFAFDEYILNFENGAGDWTRISASGDITTEYVDAERKNALFINSPNTLAKCRKELENPVLADDKIYSLSYDVMIPDIKNEQTKQTVTVCALGANNVMGFYGLRIDNGAVSYPNGIDTTSISTAYSGGEVLKISQGSWHTLKTVY